jgi:hypothetical protein
MVTDRGTYDVYSCTPDAAIMGRTIIMRYGSDGPEYTSAPESILADMIKSHISPIHTEWEIARLLYQKYLSMNG